jgi:hypothetical protein
LKLTQLRSIKMVCMSVILLSLFMIVAIRVSAEQKEDAVVAEVNGEKITLNEFQEAVKEAAKKAPGLLSEKEKLQLLDNMIVEKLLYKEALDKKLNEDPAVIKQFEQAKRNILVKNIVKQEITSKMKPVTPEEIADYYEKNKAAVTFPDKAKVEYLSVLKSTVVPNMSETTQTQTAKWVEEEARKVAAEIKEAVSKGESLDALVKRYRALDPQNTPFVENEKTTFIAKGTLYTGSNFDQVVFNLKPGEAGTVEFPERIEVIRMIKIAPGVVQPLNDVQPEIAGKLEQERWSEKFKDFTSRLKEAAKIDVHSDLIK